MLDGADFYDFAKVVFCNNNTNNKNNNNNNNNKSKATDIYLDI